MGVLATLAASLFPDFFADGVTAFRPPLGNFRTFAAAIDAAIPNAQDLSAVLVRLAGDEANLGNLDATTAALQFAINALQALVNVIDQRQAGDEANLGNLDVTTANLTGALNALQQAVTTLQQQAAGNGQNLANLDASTAQHQGAINSLEGNVADLLQSSGAAVAALNALDAAVSVLQTVAGALAATGRPGDAAALFCSSLAGGDSSGFVLDPAITIVATDGGQAARITNAPAFVCARVLQPVEPFRTYKARWVVRRRTDSPDPAGDAVGLAIAFYDGNGQPLGVTTNIVVQNLGLTVAMGRVEVSAVLSLNPVVGAKVPVLTIPAGTCSARPFVQTYGSTHVTDVQVVEWRDISDAGLVAPNIDAVLALVNRILSLDLGTRMGELEAEMQSIIGGSSTLTAAATAALAVATTAGSVAALKAADPALLASTLPIFVRGYYADGDGGHGYFRLVSSPPDAQGNDTRPADDGGSIFRSATVGYYFARVGQPQMAFRAFGARGDGVTDDTAAFRAMAAFCNRVLGGVEMQGAPGDVHMVWPAAQGTNTPSIIVLNTASRWKWNGAQIYTDNAFADGDFSLFFQLNAVPSFYCEGLNLQAPNCVGLDDQKGPVAYYLFNGCRNIEIHNHRQFGGRHGVRCEMGSPFYVNSASRASGIILLNAVFDSVYYPINLEASGDQFFGRNIKTHNCGRSLFFYNVRDLDVELESDHGGPFMDILVKTYCASAQSTYKDANGNTVQYNASFNVTSDFRVKYTNKGRCNRNRSQAWVSLEYEQIDYNAAPGTIRNGRFELDTEVDANGMPDTGIVFYKFDAGEKADNAARGYVTENITFTGSIKGCDYGQLALNIADPYYGSTVGDVWRNVRFESLEISGAQTACQVHAEAFTSGLIFDGVTGTAPWTLLNPPLDVVDVRSCTSPGLATSFQVPQGNKQFVIPLGFGWRRYLLDFGDMLSGNDQDTLTAVFSGSASGSNPFSGGSTYVEILEQVQINGQPQQQPQSGSVIALIANVTSGDQAGVKGRMDVTPGYGTEGASLDARTRGRVGPSALLSYNDVAVYLANGSTALQSLVLQWSGGIFASGYVNMRRG